MAEQIVLGAPNIAKDLRLTPQARRILAHLEEGKSITPMEALVVYGISRLSDVILKIRSAGHQIDMELRKDETGHRYGRYTLVRSKSING